MLRRLIFAAGIGYLFRRLSGSQRLARRGSVRW
jgi:hypothetical protein